jgi:hypothetical protein
MRKVPPILKPIALLTLSILIATTTGILNNSSYRQVKATTPTTSTTESATSRTTDSSSDLNSVTNETNTIEGQTSIEESKDTDAIVESSAENNQVENTQPSTDNNSVASQPQSSTQSSQTVPSQQQPADAPIGSKAGDSQ